MKNVLNEVHESRAGGKSSVGDLNWKPLMLPEKQQ